MTAGVVNSAYEAVVPLSLQSPAGQSREIETVRRYGRVSSG